MAQPRSWKRLALGLYEVPVLLAVAAYAFWIRMMPYDALVGGPQAFYIGTDPYYHFRVVVATVANFPWTLRFDPFTFYPLGTGTGQFGSLFDVLAAGLAIVLGGGNPTRHDIQVAVGVLPAILGALLVVPFYFLARRMFGRVGAGFAILALGLFPGEFLVRSLAGYADHHVAEALGMVLAVLGVYAAIETAARHGDALGAWRSNPRGLLRPALAAGLGALGLVVYFLIWPPAVLIVAVLGLFIAVQFTIDHFRGLDTRYLAFAGAASFGLAGLLLLPTAETSQLNFNTFSLLQPVSCLLAAAACVVLHGTSALLHARRFHPFVFPAGGFGAAVAGFASVKFGLPGLYGSLYWGASWVTGIGVKRTTLTIAEARPSTMSDLFGEYGALIYVMIAVLGLLAVNLVRRPRRAELLLLIWSVLMLQAARTQIRFTYYLALVVALAFGYLAAFIADVSGLNRGLAHFFHPEREKIEKGRGRRAKNPDRVTGVQVFAVASVALLLLPVNLIETREGIPGWRYAQIRGADYDLKLWTSELHWVRDHTPPLGIDLKTLYDRPPPGERFTYPAGSYGILSWWDYGHWTEVEAERPPVANPFQQAAPFASKYFTETDEAKAEAMLESWTAQNPSAGPVRYVMIDDEMAAGKYGAITVWAEKPRPGCTTFVAPTEACPEGSIPRRRMNIPDTGQEVELPVSGRPYEDAMLSRLYFGDGSGLHRYRLVHETEVASTLANIVGIKDERLTELNLNELLNRDTRDPDEVGTQTPPSQLLRISSGRYAYDVRLESAVKTYERVKGAHLVGKAEPGETVTATAPLHSESTRRNFTYETSTVADAEGNFDLVVAYSTTGPIPLAEGGTDFAVRALDGYLIYTGPRQAPARTAFANVPERSVLDGTRVDVTWGQ